MRMMLPKTAIFMVLSLLIATAWSYPQEAEYDDYEYQEETVEYGDPPEFAMDSQHLTAKEGETIIVPCQPTEATPYVLIIKKAAEDQQKEKLIFVGDVKVPLHDRHYKLEGGQMEISNLRRSDAGTYVCRMESQPNPREVSHVVDVQYAPKITAVTAGEQRVHKGDSVKLECQVEGNPIPNIKWSRHEGRLPSGLMEEEGLSITLEEVDRHVEGTYVCTADNGIGDPVSDMLSVAVEYQPEIITEKDMVRTDEGDTVELVCIVHARPVASVEWTKDGAPLAIDNHIEEQQNGGHRNSIRISQISEADFGEYICTAENKFGVVESTISMSGLPKPPQFTSDPNGGEETSYTLTWQTESYYPITEYRLKYRKTKANDSTDEPGEWMDMTYEVNNNLETNGLTHSMKHALNNLEAATDYDAFVQIKNQYMWGNSTEFSFSTKKETAQPAKVNGASSVGFSALLLLITSLILRT